MCHYCGCRGAGAIAALSAGHERMLAIAAALTAAACADDDETAKELIRELGRLVAEHVEIEEGYLFPALLAANEDALVCTEHLDVLRHDHALLLAYLEEPHAGSVGWATELLEQLTDLGAHIIKEEYGVFPEAFASLAPEQWDELEEHCTAVLTPREPVPA